MAKSSKWFFIILGLSLSLNLFFAGMMVGERMHKPPHKGQKTHKTQGMTTKVKKMNGQFTVRRLVSALPKDRRQEATQYVKENRNRVGKSFREQKQAQIKLYQLMTAETLDMGAIKKALEKEQVAKKALENYSRSIMLKVLPSLNQEERKKFVRQIMRSGHMGGSMGDKKRIRKKRDGQPSRPEKKTEEAKGSN